MTWKDINDSIGKKHHRRISEVLHNNVKVTDSKQIAEFFSNYFGSVATNLQSNTPNSNIFPMSFMGVADDLSMQYELSTYLEVENIGNR